MKKSIFSLSLVALALSTATVCAQDVPKFSQTTDIPPSLLTSDSVETRIGTLNFFDGLPDKTTINTVYDNLDFMRGVEAFLRTMPAASLSSIRDGMQSAGVNNTSVLLYEGYLDSKPLWLTVNTETVTLGGWINLKDGPVVMEVPPKILGFVDDFWFSYVADIGNLGPDRGEGGKYLFVGPDYWGPVPGGYHIVRSKTYNLWYWLRGFSDMPDPAPTVKMWKAGFKQYPLSMIDNPPETTFINGTGLPINTIHASDETFYEEVNKVVQEEPSNSQNPEILGTLQAIGIEKGKAFAPDKRMKAILKEAAAVGNATARAISFRTRNEKAYIYNNSGWFTPSPGGDYQFLQNGATVLDSRTLFFFMATGITPAMANAGVGVGSQYAGTTTDINGDWLNGSNTYRLHLPANVPAQNFWSITVYDTQTRSELQTDQTFPVLNSTRSGLAQNPDGSYDIYFSPEAPKGHEKNWIQTIPGKSWWTILRLYSPGETWFDKSWRLGEVELVSDGK